MYVIASLKVFWDFFQAGILDGKDICNSLAESLAHVALKPTLNRLSYLVTVSAKSIFSRLPTNWRSSGRSSIPM